MSSFSLDEAAVMFQADIGSLLPRLEEQADEILASLGLDLDDGEDPFAALEYVGHSLRGVSRTVGAEAMAECGAAVELIALEGRKALQAVREAKARARMIATVLRAARRELSVVADEELARRPDGARARAMAWQGSLPTGVRTAFQSFDAPAALTGPGKEDDGIVGDSSFELVVDEVSPTDSIPDSGSQPSVHAELTRELAVVTVDPEAPSDPQMTAQSFGAMIRTSDFQLQDSFPEGPDDEILDDELREAFRSEVAELVQPARSGFALLGADVRGAAADLDRLFHTMKGAAASVGLSRVAEICKELEHTFEEVSEGTRAWDSALASHVRALARSAFGIAGIEFGLATESAVAVAPIQFELEEQEQSDVNEMVEAFRLEVRELSASIRDTLVRLNRGGGGDLLERLERAYHTIRGAAATVDLPEIAAVAQELQETTERALDSEQAPGKELLAGLVERTNELFLKVRLPPVEVMESAASDEVEADFRLEAQDIMGSVGNTVELAFGVHAPETRDEARSRMAGLLHRLGGAAAMNQRTDVSDEALQLEREILNGTITAATFSDGIQRIAARLEILLPNMPALETAVKEASSGSVRAVPEATIPAGPTRETVEIMAEREVYDAFVEECAVLLESIDTAILSLQESAEPRKILAELARLVHTLKGSVNTVGLHPTGKVLHRVEDALDALNGRSVIPSGRAIASLLLATQEEVRRHLRTAPRGYVDSNFAALDRDIESLLGTGRRNFVKLAEAPAAADNRDEQDTERENRSIRISSERIDQLMTLAGEMVLSRSRLLSRVRKLRTMQRDLVGSRGRLLSVVDSFVDRYQFNLMGSGPKKLMLEDTGRVPVLSVVDELASASAGQSQGGFSDLELDRYEDVNILARSLAEVSSDINEVHQILFSELGSFVEDSESFSNLVSTLQREVTATRMLPMESLYTRVRLLVIDAAERERKEVRTELTGRQVPLDKTILDALYMPLLHVVRNAVTHGIETPEERIRAGKPAAGVVTIAARQEAGRVVIEVSDDGAGLNLRALRDRGAALGLIPADTPEDSPLVPNLVFAAGLSTRATANAQAGRGIGGDAVKASIEALNGSVSVSTTPGRGTVFQIVVPLTLAIMRALVVKNGPYSYAVPLYLTEHILQSSDAKIIESSGIRRLVFEEQSILAMPIGDLLGIPGENANGPYVITRVGDARLAVQVDSVTRQEEVFVRGLGTVLAGHPLFAGVTVSGAGEAELIVDVNGLMAAAGVTTRIEASRAHVEQDTGTARTKSSGPRRRRALVVDDSLSVRKVAEKFLKSLGIDVVLAVDGQDALEKLRVEKVDIVFTDLEMPRMHGYELIREIRFIPAFTELPIAVVTSRSSQKHRDHARALGANDYVTKPFTQDRFAEILTQWLGWKAEQRAEAT